MKYKVYIPIRTKNISTKYINQNMLEIQGEFNKPS